jgi:shikimate kinase
LTPLHPDDGYYGWAPRAALERPLVLTGFLGARVGRVGNVLAGLTGHRHVDLLRAVEHRAGRSVDALVVAEGEAALAGWEAPLLRQALRDSPPPIVSLGHRTLLDPALRAEVAARATLVYVRIDLSVAQRRLTREVAERVERHFAWLGGEPPRPKALRVGFDAVRPGYEAADHVVDGAPPAADVAREIARLLGMIPEGSGG